MIVSRVTDQAQVRAAAHLFDLPPDPLSTRRFLTSDTHHLLVAEDEPGGRALGMISGVEMTHPDKGSEMFVHELGVDVVAQRRGVGTALVEALAALARERGCVGMWVAVDADNEAALATYRRAGASDDPPARLLSWEFDVTAS